MEVLRAGQDLGVEGDHGAGHPGVSGVVGVGPRFQAIRRLVHEKATSLGLTSTDALSTAINGDEDRLAIDQIHPDDAGHARMARAMISFYAEILPGA